ncbi:protein phosphatase 4, regulatory subunit 2 [Mortierella claussenii]|nr:protein phosphatase 4, regulatory subunit 2 [Mortierella claussenii]
MTELAQSTSPSTESIVLIQEIAMTNQVSVPWEELRTVLKQRLDQVLESKQLIYTAPTVTNPLTIRLTPISSLNGSTEESAAAAAVAASQDSSSQAESVSSIPASLKDEIPNNVTTGDQDQDQAHVPEQEEKEEEIASDQKEETLARGDKEETGSRATEQDAADRSSVDAEEKLVNDELSSEQLAGPIPTATNGETSTTPENAAVVIENGPAMIPISKDTLLVETQEGYHERINGLFDAFTSAPFTIQRVCELLSNPTEHHSNLLKYLRAVEKVLMITSSINEFSNPAYNGPSALDEDNDNISTEPTTANGDYSSTTNLDFSLITETPALSPQSEEDNKSEKKESTSEEAADKSLWEQTGDAEGLGSTAQEDTMMEVESAATEPSSNMEVDGTSASTMDGVETETNGAMDVDQA